MFSPSHAGQVQIIKQKEYQNQGPETGRPQCLTKETRTKPEGQQLEHQRNQDQGQERVFFLHLLGFLCLQHDQCNDFLILS